MLAKGSRFESDIEISFAPSFHYVDMLARTCIAFRVASRIHFVVALEKFAIFCLTASTTVSVL